MLLTGGGEAIARPKKYDEKTLARAVERYFRSISRKVPVTERVDTGERDDSGHVIYTTVPVKNLLGKEAETLEYLVPPTVGGLCAALGIHRSTWAEYCDHAAHPELTDTTQRARERMRAYLEEQLLTRKDVRGVTFELNANYGYSSRSELELGERATAAIAASTIPAAEREALLREIAEEFRQGEAGDDG